MMIQFIPFIIFSNRFIYFTETMSQKVSKSAGWKFQPKKVSSLILYTGDFFDEADRQNLKDLTEQVRSVAVFIPLSLAHFFNASAISSEGLQTKSF